MGQTIIDGSSKLFICEEGLETLNVKKLYSEWKEWQLISDNSKYLKAFEVVGGDPTVGSNIITPYFFLDNGWRVRPQEANHTLEVNGILLVKGGGDVFVDTLGVYRIGINAIIPIYTETIMVTPELTKQDVRDAMALTIDEGQDISIDSLEDRINRIDRGVQK